MEVAVLDAPILNAAFLTHVWHQSGVNSASTLCGTLGEHVQEFAGCLPKHVVVLKASVI